MGRGRHRGLHQGALSLLAAHGGDDPCLGAGRHHPSAPADAIAEVLAALAGYGATGAELWRTTQAAAAAELCARAGKLAEGLGLCAEGLDVGVARGERLFLAELLRVRGELLRARGDEAAAGASFLAAREEAQRRGARALELRVADSLAGS